MRLFVYLVCGAIAQAANVGTYAGVQGDRTYTQRTSSNEHLEGFAAYAMEMALAGKGNGTAEQECFGDARLLRYWGARINAMGEYAACKKVSTAHYCSVEVLLTNINPLDIKGYQEVGLLGVCVPKVCNATLLGYLIDKYMTDVIGPDYHFTVSRTNPFAPAGAYMVFNPMCDVDVPPPVDWAATFTIVILVILLAMCLLGTAAELWEGKEPKVELNSIQSDAPVEKSSLLQHQRKKKGNGLTNFLKTFAIPHNFSRLIAPVPGRTSCLNGMRVISMAWIILGHTMFFGLEFPSWINYAEFTDIATRDGYFFIIPSRYAVDSFFWLSGFLVGFMAIKQLKKFYDKKPSVKRQAGFWGIFYFHRYYRLTPVLFILLLFWYKVVPQVGDGPIWFKVVYTCQHSCDEYWWTNILYINNLYPSDELKECLGWGWYLANDMQFYLLAPIPLYLYCRDRKALAYTFLTLLMVGSYIWTAVMSYHDLSENAINYLTGQPYNIYTKPQVRIPPYLIGFITAFFLHQCAPTGVDTFRTDAYEEGTLPYKVRNALSKRWMRWFTYSVGGGMLLSGMFFDFKSITDHQLGRDWDVEYLVILDVWSRICWGWGLSLVFCPWILGWGGIPQMILSHQIWTPLARTTYAAYLVHPMLQTIFYGTLTQTPVYSNLYLTFLFLGFFTASYLAGFIVFLVLEKPVMNLEKYILPQH